MAGIRTAYPVQLGFAELRGTLKIKQRGKGKKQPVKESRYRGRKEAGTSWLGGRQKSEQL